MTTRQCANSTLSEDRFGRDQARVADRARPEASRPAAHFGSSPKLSSRDFQHTSGRECSFNASVLIRLCSEDDVLRFDLFDRFERLLCSVVARIQAGRSFQVSLRIDEVSVSQIHHSKPIMGIAIRRVQCNDLP